MKKKREAYTRIKRDVLATERALVMQFVMEHVEPNDSFRVHTCTIFGAYKKWLKQRGWEPSQLSIDGFGRLFPKGFQRDKFHVQNKLAKGVIGVKLNAKI